MAQLTAEITYGNSGRRFSYKARRKAAKIYGHCFEWRRSGERYVVQTYKDLGTPKSGVGGIRLDLDEEAAKSLIAVLQEMISKYPKP